MAKSATHKSFSGNPIEMNMKVLGESDVDRQVERERERETKRMNNSNADILNHMSNELLTC